MKFLFVFAGFNFGGAEHVICNLANQFVQDGYEITLVAMTRKDWTYTIDARVKVINGIERRNDFEAIVRLRKVLISEQPNLVLSFLTHINISVIVAGLGTGIPVVVSERNDPATIPPEALRRLLRKLIYPFAKGYVFQTQEAMRFFSKRIQKRSRIIPNPLFIQIEMRSIQDRNREIVSVGRMVPQKRHDLILRAFAGSEARKNGYSLHFYGSDEDGEIQRLQSHAQELGIADSVFSHGSVSDLHERIQGASIFVLASDYEGMPNAIMEAMALGLACISTDCPCGGPRFLIQDAENGLLIPVGDQSALRSAIDSVAMDDCFRAKLSLNAILIREKLDGIQIYRQWMSYLDSKSRQPVCLRNRRHHV
jgi:glycosyltransferase involved in cell wall biosynthesis